MQHQWTREMLKTCAKDVLRRHYWMIFLACFVAGLLGGGVSGGGGSVSTSGGQSSSSPGFMAVFIVVMLLVILFSVFFSNIVHVGLCRFLLEARHGRTEISTLFWAFKEGRYMKTVEAMFMYQLRIFLWSLLLVIPGIIKAYEYYYFPYMLAENPDIPYQRLFELSRTMTYGEKLDIFILELSFIGWSFLGILTCGIGLLFLAPYISMTYAELYAFVKVRSINENITNASELPEVYDAQYYQQYQQPYPYQQQPPYPYQQPPYPNQQQPPSPGNDTTR